MRFSIKYSGGIFIATLFIKIATGLVVLGAITASVIAYVGREQALTLVFGDVKYEPIDFSSLTLGPNPNQFLVCPNDLCKAKPHLTSPNYNFPAEALMKRWESMISEQARIESGPIDSSLMQYDYIQRSALMRYPDRITVRFIALMDNHSTLAIYSRSHYGKSDLGVNEARIRAWLSALR